MNTQLGNNENGLLPPGAMPQAAPAPTPRATGVEGLRRIYRKLGRSMPVRIAVILPIYAAALALSLWVSYQLRFDFAMPALDHHEMYLVMIWATVMKLVLMGVFGKLHAHPAYFGLASVSRLAYAMGAAAAILFAVRVLTGSISYAPPRGVILTDLALSIAAIASVRIFFRVLRQRVIRTVEPLNGRVRRIAVIGAGDAGETLVADLLKRPGRRLKPVLFLDDDPMKWKYTINNLPVLGPPESLSPELLQRHRIDEVMIAMPSASNKRLKEVVALLQKCRVDFRTLPSVDELVTGRVSVSRVRQVKIEDLLGREPAELNLEAIRQEIAGRVVLVTGAGGSIGSELCRQIASFGPSRLHLVDRSEPSLFDIEQELIMRGHGGILRPHATDIIDTRRLRKIFTHERPDLVFHAAAHKHVPMMESQPGEAILNNSIATAKLAVLAAESGVERFVMISTDKAINPTSVMGASKRLAELYVQALHGSRPGPTRFMAVRFGNVLGSSGSVIPVFRRQIAEGGPVTVTHPDMTRYFMTIPEAVGLVLQCATLGTGGEVFFLDMGAPVRIADLARQMILLSGFQPGEDIEIRYTGLRPGEKLFEELSHHLENCLPTDHPRIVKATGQPETLEKMIAILNQFSSALYRADAAELKAMLKEAIPEYTPYVPPIKEG